ncbi:ANTAR domain-containing protein [Friedmanniella luteola]|uniref:ANTAR domain-containing protein n=1 Tax=Friedmanniella luteola TaxID=546871 RepID=A0A1H1XLY5_9ACTN|nr:ANTAR domain-containing protein [Friedmanniella luteola]SDT10237.1 ANTAR domain-containing protein [Friedmanniella luteola]
MDLSQIDPSPPAQQAVTSAGRRSTSPEVSSTSHHAPSSTSELRVAAALLDAATRMHDSTDPGAVLDVIACEALRLLTADGVLVLVHAQRGPTPVLHRLQSGADADPAVTDLLCKQLADEHLVERSPVTDLERRRMRRLETSGGDGTRTTPWPSLLVADLDSPRSSRPTRLVWYAADDNAFTSSRELAVLFARHAGLALRAVSERHHLLRAVESRTSTGQATGILMNRYHLTAARAFELLRTFSQDRNIKLRDVAEALNHTGELPS